MRRILYIIFIFIALFCFASCDNSISPLDEILDYKITVDPTKEGNLNMHYQIKWKVLNDTKEGPLTWVKIGIPNRYVENLKQNSQSIENCSYYSENGAFIRLDLDRSYYAGEIVVLDFEFLQTHIYTINDDEVHYQFIPGWFEEIKVDNLTVYWNKNNIIKWNNQTTEKVQTREEGQYYVWEAKNLDFGETITVEIQYLKSSFENINKDNTYSASTGEEKFIIIVICVVALIFLIVVICSIIYNKRHNDGYYSYRGFSGSVHHFWFFYHPGYNGSGQKLRDPRVVNRSSGGHSGSSCACACACAGGGRAGCSRKDFYNPNLEIDKLTKILKEKEEKNV